MTAFRQTITGTRDSGAGAYVEGVWVPGGTTPLSFKASVQPLRPDEMEQLPEGRRSGQAYKMYTDTELRTMSQSGQYNADKVVIRGDDYEVVSVYPYQSGVISHFKILAVRIE